MVHKDFFKRGICFVLGLFFIALGIAFVKYSNLGISPISSLANVLSIKFTSISFGMWCFITNCLLVLAQILMLRKAFSPFQLLQIPLSFLSGYFTDLGLLVASIVPNNTYFARISFVIVGVIVLGLGIALTVKADILLYPGEALIKTISERLNKNFGNVKVCFDVSCVALATVISMLLFSGTIVGTREGTLISAVFTGIAVKQWNRLLKRF